MPSGEAAHTHNDQNNTKKEEIVEEELDEDPYSGYEEKNENTRAADLYLDTVSRKSHLPSPHL